MADALVGYDQSDPYQVGFLHALASGESGGSNPFSEGVGGTDLSGASTDANGFPIWQGLGNSHAAGAYQFQPGTWATIAGQLGITSFTPTNQDDAAWVLAEQTYQQKTGGSLETALQQGNYSSIQSALSGIWPSVTGNQANPTGLASVLSSNVAGANNSIATADQSGGTAGGITASGSGTAVEGANPNGFMAGIAGKGAGVISSIVGGTENIFERGGLLLIGAIIIIAALWALLADRGYVPSPKQLVKAAI